MAKSRIYDATLRLVDKFSEPLKKMEKHLDNFERHYKNTGAALFSTGKKFEGLGKSMMKNITAPIVGIGALSVKSFKEIDSAMDTIVTKTGATGQAVKDFEKVFKNIGGNMPVELGKVGDAIGEVNTQFGLVDKALENSSKQFIKFSEINGQDVSQAAIQAKQAMEAYELGVDDLDKILDSVTATAQATGQGTDKLFETIVKGAPQIKDLNLGFEQATALLGSLEQNGVDSTKALSYMTKAQVIFAKNGKNLTTGLENLQKELDGASGHAEKLTIASKYFGTKGATFMLDALERGTLDFDKFANAAELAMGAVDKTFEETLDPIDRFKELFNKLKFVGNGLFKASEGIWTPILDKVINKVEKLSKWFESLSDKQKQNIVKWLGFAATLGPAIFGLGKVLKIGGKLNFKLADFAKSVGKAGGILKWITSPANLFMLKILAIIIVVALLIKYWDKIKAKAEEVFPGIGDNIGKLAEKAKELFSLIVEFAKSALDNLMQNWSEIWPLLAPFVETMVKVVGGVLDGLIKILTGILDFIIGVFTGDWSRAWDGVKLIFSGVWDSIKSIAKGAIDGIIDLINGVIGGLNSFSIPDWVPKIGGKGINIPLIPQLAKGTNFWKGGIVQINERGGEIVDLPTGSRVMPHDKSVQEAYQMGQAKKEQSLSISIPKLADQIIVREEADIDRIVNSLANRLKIAKLNAIGGV